MTLTDINKALSNLAEQPTRENILAFSFELLHWMNITPNADNKPQLLSPQTQKLKDYLANAPQTVQPQLYRLSADNQPIRVRFAVLKKLKKEYISQLVDNDPGLGSYQAMAKGLTIPATGTAFIPAQPYFVHFVTTPDYDKLVLIFNQGEQKRIVSFRNRLTNTQYHKIIQAWQGIGSKAKPEIADLLWKSLDIKEVNKEFYKQIKERFDALLGIVKTQHSTATENQVKQFTVRMIGRYIFCWFLKEKGIIPLSLICKQTIESTENYYQTVLLKLFFETLNTKVQDRDPLKHNKLFEKIPYLNGGLFDESEEDKLFIKLDLDAWLLPFVEILESYDFTVDESSSQYQQVAVDPEMLGRIFENLLASQNEETEKLANQRKAFGAFYTPREIVDYMVNESIKAFLQTQWEQNIEADKTKHINNPEPIGDIFGNKKPQQLAIETKRYELKPEEKQKIEKTLESLFASNPDAGHLKKDEKTMLLGFLEQIKILDPACGSGAFPMGILHKLVELHEALGTVKSSYELKKDILSQNIYGVDIMPMAIEIARLRAWLSLVLEEDYKPTDPKHNFGVKPLPNLDFKFVCANSLIDLGLDAFIQESKGTLHEGFTQKLVKDLKDLETLRTNFFNPTLASSQKEQLKSVYFEKRDKVIVDIEAAHDPILKQIAQKIKHWNPFDDSKPSLFFSPTWMFGIDKGFDVVIGNPPYVLLQEKIKNEIELNYFKDHYDSASYKVDLYHLFLEKGVNLLKENSSLCFITPSNFLSNNYNKLLRNFLVRRTTPKAIINITESVFEASVDTTISLLIKGGNIESSVNFYKGKYDEKGLSISFIISKKRKDVIEDVNSLLIPADNQDTETLLTKIEKSEHKLGKIAKVNFGMQLRDREEYPNDVLVSTNGNDLTPFHRKCLTGKDINPYAVEYHNLYCYFNREAKRGGCWDDKMHSKKNKILIRQIGATPIAGLDEFGFPLLNSAFMVYSELYSNKFLLGIINSSVVKIYWSNKFADKRKTFPKIKGGYLELIPIKKPTKIIEAQIEKLVDEILKKKKANQDTSSLEKEIDVLVYHLYELTYDEVKIIDKEFWLSEEEYTNYKMQ
jgi:methylase of polypeptide subunit release factors